MQIALMKRTGIKHMAHIEIEGYKRVYAISDEDLERETGVKTSAAHFCRFEFNEAVKKPLNMAVAITLITT